MSNSEIFPTFQIYCFTILLVSVISLENKNVTISLSKSFLNGDSSHEESHSRIAPSKEDKHMGTNNVTIVTKKPPIVTTFEVKEKILINTNKTHLGKHKNVSEKDNTLQAGNVHMIPTEGGTIHVHDGSKQKADQDILRVSSTVKERVNQTNHIRLSYDKTTSKVNLENKTTLVIEEKESSTSEKPKSKRIHGRPGVQLEPLPVSSSTASPTTEKHKKPLFTVITGDKETIGSESFIESPTTGRDYVLPIVLIILSLPIVGYIIKLIYKRGTEFTERQQYHRMYLIDGMYNSR